MSQAPIEHSQKNEFLKVSGHDFSIFYKNIWTIHYIFLI